MGVASQGRQAWENTRKCCHVAMPRALQEAVVPRTRDNLWVAPILSQHSRCEGWKRVTPEHRQDRRWHYISDPAPPLTGMWHDGHLGPPPWSLTHRGKFPSRV